MTTEYELVLLVDGIHQGNDTRDYDHVPTSAEATEWARELVAAGDWGDWSGSGKTCHAVVYDNTAPHRPISVQVEVKL